MFLSSGNAHTLRRAQRASVIDENGIVYSWGNNERNQLNIQELCSDSEEYKTINFVSISSGYSHTSAIDEHGIIYSWGNNDKNQLDIPSDYKTIKFVSISSGGYHTLRRAQPYASHALRGSGPKVTLQACEAQRASAIDENGIIYSWGSNDENQLDILLDYKTIRFKILYDEIILK